MVPVLLMRTSRPREMKSRCHVLRGGTTEPGFEPGQPGSGSCTVLPLKAVTNRRVPLSSFSIPRRIGHAIERLRTHFKGGLEGRMGIGVVGRRSPPSHQLAFEEGHSGEGLQGHSQPLHRTRLEANRRTGRSLLLIGFLESLSVGLSGAVTTAPSHPRVSWLLRGCLSPVAYRTRLRTPGCRSVGGCSGHSHEFNRSPHRPLRCPPGTLQTSPQGFRPAPGLQFTGPPFWRPHVVIQEAQQCIQV